MARFLVLLAALVASVAAFAPPPASTAAARTTQLNAYVPAGLSPAEYKKKQEAESAKKAKNKSRFPKNKPFVGIGEWLKTMEGRQKFQGQKYTASGHTYAKVKFKSKDEFDKAMGRK